MAYSDLVVLLICSVIVSGLLFGIIMTERSVDQELRERVQTLIDAQRITERVWQGERAMFEATLEQLRRERTP
jgi:hypothetical protein